MISTYTQARSLISITTPLGADALLLTAFSGQEGMSQLFSYQLDMLSAKDAIAPADIVGKGVTWLVRRADRDPRYFNGIVSRFSAGGGQLRGLRRYRAEVVPQLWFLTRTADCRIFQNKTVPQIIEQVFKDLGFTAYQLALEASYVQHDYIVQYRETDFAFVSRLMEQEGIFYFFLHENGKHTMVLADKKTAYKACPEGQVDMVDTYLPGRITHWEHQYEFRPGKWAQTDYNFETPSTSLMTNTATTVQLPGNTKYEVYDYPGLYGKKGDGDALTKVRMEEEEAAHDVVSGAGTCTTFSPGLKFTLKSHASSAEKGKSYVLTSVSHWAREGAYDGDDSANQDYGNTFTCIPAAAVFRPSRTTRKPVVQGPQTAVVVGPKGEEIYTDKYGRIKVQFFWDREGKKDENSSCWLRVGTVWAGKQWGMIHIPRIGQEVIVDFLEGDPDQPLVVGSVYNADMMPPYQLPDNKTQSGLKSRSSLKGTPENFNEIRFEDKKGEEQLFIHAEKNQEIGVENDETHWVGRDRKKTIDRDETVLVQRDRKETVGRNELITVEKDRTEEVQGNEGLTVAGNRTRQVNKDESITIDGNRTESVGKDEKITVGGNREHNVTGKDQLSVGKELLISVTDKITLVTGDASIIMDKSGDIQIKGKNITIVGSGKINAKADSDVILKGSNVKAN